MFSIYKIFILYLKFKPSCWGYIKKYKLILKKLRNMGREQILNRLKLIQENLNVPNDMLTNFLKAFGIFKLIFLKLINKLNKINAL